MKSINGLFWGAVGLICVAFVGTIYTSVTEKAEKERIEKMDQSPPVPGPATE